MNQTKLNLLLLLPILLIHSVWSQKGLNLVAPPDIVISRNFTFTLSDLTDPNNATFGRIVDDLSLRKKIVTEDLVCRSYCFKNLYSGYPGLIPGNPNPKPASNIACDYFNLYFDSAHIDRKYELVWGFDGYLTNGNINDLIISIRDLRVCDMGLIERIFSIQDSNQVVHRDTQSIWIVDCSYIPNYDLKCKNNVIISLDQNCNHTLNANDFLENQNGYCSGAYTIKFVNQITHVKVDRDSILKGIQLDNNDIGGNFEATIIDPITSNKCSTLVSVQDSTPPQLICPKDITITCDVNDEPKITGIAIAEDNCRSLTLSYVDKITAGSCSLQFDHKIKRVWKAIDGSGNTSTCVQFIMVNILDLNQVVLPKNFDNIDQPVLKCHDRYTNNIIFRSHLTGSPECVDGWLLDSVFWRSNPLEPNEYPKRRLPRILGWNIIQDSLDPNFGHPNPYPKFYPQHFEWSLNNPLCWSNDQHIMWKGTGFPTGDKCKNLSMSYTDSVISLSSGNCISKFLNCGKILRKWFILDWCSGVFTEKIQIIKIEDSVGPNIIYPDSVSIGVEAFNCTANWNVPPPWIILNCSDLLDYKIEILTGTIQGNYLAGYQVSGLKEGYHNLTIIATNCCGAISTKSVVLHVVDQTPPVAVCKNVFEASIINGEYVQINALTFDEHSFDNCQSNVFFKVIKNSQLLGTSDGSLSDQIECGPSQDDDQLIPGHQIYFDDAVSFCCSEVNTKQFATLRVFDAQPGIGPIHPDQMKAGGNLYGKFSDCIIEIVVKNNSGITIVSPPNMVVSCNYYIDLIKAADPNDNQFGRIVTNINDRTKVTTSDKVCHAFCEKNDATGYPGFFQTNQIPVPESNTACSFYHQFFDTLQKDKKYELVWGFDGYVLSACESSFTIIVKDMRVCGQGKIERVISSTGASNNVVAIQTIWVVDCYPFHVDDTHCNDSLYSDIMWPSGICNNVDIVLDGCMDGIGPNNSKLGMLKILNNANDNCSLITTEFSDEIIPLNNNYCFKINRKWTVVDWCQYDPAKGILTGRWEKIQSILVIDSSAPQVVITFGNQTKLDSTFFASIQIKAMAHDQCTADSQLSYIYLLDENNDGIGIYDNSYEYKVGPLSPNMFKNGQVPINKDNPRAFNPLNPFDASGRYPKGKHKIKWIVSDACGNMSMKEEIFEIDGAVGTVNIFTKPQITIFPNPSNGKLHVESNILFDHYKILDMTGRVIKFEKTDSKNYLNLEIDQSGIYLISLMSKGHEVVHDKFVVVR